MATRTTEQIKADIDTILANNPGSIWLYGHGIMFTTPEGARQYYTNDTGNGINQEMFTIQHSGEVYYKFTHTNIFD